MYSLANTNTIGALTLWEIMRNEMNLRISHSLFFLPWFHLAKKEHVITSHILSFFWFLYLSITPTQLIIRMGSDISKFRDPKIPAFSRLNRKSTSSAFQISSEGASISPQNKLIEGRQYRDSPNAYFLPNDSTEWNRERQQNNVLKAVLGG